MRIAFIIQTHKHPAQLRRLLERLSHPQVDCYVHIDAKCKMQEWTDVLDMPQVFTVNNRADVTWAGWGIVQASINGMQAVVDAGKNYHYITLLSGQDYILEPVTAIYDRLCAIRDGRQFMDVISDAELEPKMTKMNHYHFVEYNFPGKYRFGQLITKLLPKRKAPLGLKLYCGSAWWTLTQDCVEYCLRYEREHSALRRFFKLTWGSDEFIFQTILMNSRYKEHITGHNLHYIDWSANAEHPKTFGMDDLPLLKASGKLFARKFDLTQAAGLLDSIDTTMLGR